MKAFNLPFFKVYLKVLKKNIGTLLIFIVVFLSISTLISLFGFKNFGGDSFTEKKVDIAFLNHDSGSALVQGLKESLSKNANFIELADDRETLQDALFFRRVVYIVRVPEGFSKKFLAGENAALEKTTVSDSAGGVYIDMLMGRYLSLARLHADASPNLTQQAIADTVKTDLTAKTDVTIRNYANNVGLSDKEVAMFNFLGYALISILFLGISTIMIVFSEKGLNRRNQSAPVSAFSMQAQLFLGNLVFMLTALTFSFTVSLLFSGIALTNPVLPLLFANALCFSVVCLSIGFLVGGLMKNRAAQSAVSNILSLGLSFLGGLFVPQYLLGEQVLLIARFLPSYWFARANNDIGALTSFDGTALRNVFASMGIELAFAAAILIVAAVLTRTRKSLAA